MVVVFDIGNVLLRWNPRNLFRKVFADEAAMEAFLATAGAMEFVGESRQGAKLPARARRAHRGLSAIRARIAHVRRSLGRDAGRPDRGERGADASGCAGQGEKVYSITNFCGDKFDLSCALYPFLRDFDGIVVSGREGIIKPDPRYLRPCSCRASPCVPRRRCSSTTRRRTSRRRARPAWRRSTPLRASTSPGELEARGLLK